MQHELTELPALARVLWEGSQPSALAECLLYARPWDSTVGSGDGGEGGTNLHFRMSLID